MTGGRTVQGEGGRFLAGEKLFHQLLGELPAAGEQLLANDRDAQGLAVVLDEVIQLFHHVDLLALGGKVPDELLRQGPHQAQL